MKCSRENDENIDLNETFGIKDVCVLNKLKYYHPMVNITVDILHDLNEGVIQFLLKNTFQLCYKLKLFTEDQLNSRLQFFNFGLLNAKKLRSTVMAKKKNCNQNATQSYVLMVHLPFILYEELCNNIHLKKILPCITTLLKILQIVYSTTVTKKDILHLRTLSENHLKSIRDAFEVNLLPKHHNLLHYGTVIERAGPLFYMGTIRYEAKHREFVDIANTEGNYKNLLKSFALRHQESMSRRQNESRDDDIILGKLCGIQGYKEKDGYNIMIYQKLILDVFPNVDDVFIAKSLKINQFIYQRNLFLHSDATF